MNSLIRFIDSYSVDTHFYLTANLAGHELILEEIYRQFGERISVTPEHLKWLKHIPQKSNRFASIGDICSLDDTRTRFHAGKYIQVNLDTLPGTFKNVKIKFCTQFFARRDCIPTTFDRNDAMVIPDVNSNDDNYKCLFSFHSSFNEIREFVEWLQPGYFKPFVFTETKEIKENEQCETRYVDYVGYFKDFCCEDIRRQWKQDDDWNLYAKPRTSIKARLLQSLFPEDDKSHETSEQRIHTDNVPVPKDSFIQVSLAVDSITSPYVPAKSNIEVTSVENQPTSLPSAVIATPRRLLSPSMTTNSPASDDTIINTPSPSKRSPILTSMSRRTSSTASFSPRHLSPSLFAPVKYVCVRDNSMINWEENDRNEKIQRARIHNIVARQVKKRRRRIQQGDEDYWEFNSLI
ncbi:hypothetical protein BKA69DRAFT_1173409 [Paraphysoderma sedebokerense]|nr:hypothetical protein BKA69DRAFT_1173409 [Paraphysoderma sedebokerense]